MQPVHLGRLEKITNQVGLVGFLATVISSMFAPLWGMLLDHLHAARKSGRGRCFCLLRSVHRTVLIAAILSASVLRLLLQARALKLISLFSHVCNTRPNFTVCVPLHVAGFVSPNCDSIRDVRSGSTASTPWC